MAHCILTVGGVPEISNLSHVLLRRVYNPNIDHVNDNVYTKFGIIPSICSQDIKQNLNSDVNQGL